MKIPHTHVHAYTHTYYKILISLSHPYMHGTAKVALNGVPKTIPVTRHVFTYCCSKTPNWMIVQLFVQHNVYT